MGGDIGEGEEEGALYLSIKYVNRYYVPSFLLRYTN